MHRHKISAWIFRFWLLYRIIFKSCSVPTGTLYSLYQMANIKTCAKCLWQPCMAAHIQIVTKFYPILGFQSRNILVQFGSSGLTYEFNFHSASRHMANAHNRAMNETLFLCKYFKMLAFIFIIRFLKWFFDEFFILKRLLLHVISIFAAQKYFLRNHFMFGLLEPEKNCWYKKGTHTNKQPTNISKYFKPWWLIVFCHLTPILLSWTPILLYISTGTAS